MTVPPEPSQSPWPADGSFDAEVPAAGDGLPEPPELTTPLHELDTIASPELTARLGEPGGEFGIGARAATDEGAIPMLTEVLAPADGPTAPVAGIDEPHAGGPADTQPIDEAGWNRIALEVQAGVLERLQNRSDQLLDLPMHERLRSVIDLASERLAEDLRETIRQTVQEAVARAITEELARVHQVLGAGGPDAGDDRP